MKNFILHTSKLILITLSIFDSGLNQASSSNLSFDRNHAFLTTSIENSNEKVLKNYLDNKLEELFIKIDTLPIVTPTNIWNEVHYDFSGQPFNARYTFGEDSTRVGSNWYFEVLKSEEFSGDNFVTSGILIREFDNKVYQLIDDEPILIYDFGLQLGDTFFIDETNTNEAKSLLVISIDSILTFDGIERKRFTFLCIDGSNGTTNWIEGIGNTNGLLDSRFSCTFDRNNRLLCFFDSDDLIYTDSTISECWGFSKTDNIDKNRFTIQPNPASDYIYVEGANKGTQYEILNSNGQLIDRSILINEYICKF